jgi:hypothetical protein
VQKKKNPLQSDQKDSRGPKQHKELENSVENGGEQSSASTPGKLTQPA